jgi:anti-sigma factor RsiW
MSHLGRRLSALVDGELGDAERDQVHAHLVGCEECRAEAAALRSLKRRVRGLGEAPADSALTRRLIELECLPDVAPPRSRLPGATRARAALSAFSGGGTYARPEWDGFPVALAAGASAAALAPASPLAAGRGRPHARYLVAGAVAALAVGLGAASFVAGGAQQNAPGPTITPEVDSFNFQHATTFGQSPTFLSPAEDVTQQAQPRQAQPRQAQSRQAADSLKP